MPGKQARALCPVCQEPLPPDETECRNCGAFVIDEAVVRLCRALGIDRAKALQLFEAGFRHPTQLRDRDVNRVLERHESGLLFLCTNCGSFVATGDPKCGRCGAEFEPDESTASGSVEEDILDLVLCPNCGADNGPEWTECEICSEPLPGAVRAQPTGPMPGPRSEPEPPPEPATVEFDAMLSELETALTPRKSARSEPAAWRASDRPLPTPPEPPVRPQDASPVVPPPPPAPPPDRLPRAPTPRPVPTPEPKPAPRPGAREMPVPIRAPSSPVTPVTTPSAPRTRLVRQPAEIRVRRRTEPPVRRPARAVGVRDLLGPAIAAAGVSLAGARAWGPGWTGWGIAFALAALAAYGIAGAWPAAILRLRRSDGILLVAGAAIGIAAPVVGSVDGGVAPGALAVLAGSAALPLAAAARRLLSGTSRSLLASASAAPMTALAVAIGDAGPYGATDAWIVGLVALLPWPIALVGVEARERAAAFAIRKEISAAERHYAGEEYSRSVDDFDRAIRLADRSAAREDLPFYGKGAALVILGRYEEALEAIDRALDINPHNEVAWVNKGNALTKMGRLVDALRAFNAAIKVNPAYEVAWNNKGNALARLERYEEALRCYEKALELDPTYRGAWVNKGYVLAKLGRYDEAAACADRVLRLGASPRAR